MEVIHKDMATLITYEQEEDTRGDGERISIGHGEESDEGVRTFKHVLAELSVNDKQEH